MVCTSTRCFISNGGVRQRVWICCLMFFCIWTYTTNINKPNCSPSNFADFTFKYLCHVRIVVIGCLPHCLEGWIPDSGMCMTKMRSQKIEAPGLSSHKASKPGSVENCTKEWWNCDLIQTNWFWDSYDLHLIAGKSPQIETSTWSQSRPRCWSIQASSSTYSTTYRGIQYMNRALPATLRHELIWSNMFCCQSSCWFHHL